MFELKKSILKLFSLATFAVLAVFPNMGSAMTSLDSDHYYFELTIPEEDTADVAGFFLFEGEVQKITREMLLNTSLTSLHIEDHIAIGEFEIVPISFMVRREEGQFVFRVWNQGPEIGSHAVRISVTPDDEPPLNHSLDSGSALTLFSPDTATLSVIHNPPEGVEAESPIVITEEQSSYVFDRALPIRVRLIETEQPTDGNPEVGTGSEDGVDSNNDTPNSSGNTAPASSVFGSGCTIQTAAGFNANAIFVLLGLVVISWRRRVKN